MFYCFLHSWYSTESPCPVCHPPITTTVSTGSATAKAMVSEQDGIVIKKGDERSASFSLTIYTEEDLKKAFEAGRLIVPPYGPYKVGDLALNDQRDTSLKLAYLTFDDYKKQNIKP